REHAVVPLYHRLTALGFSHQGNLHALANNWKLAEVSYRKSLAEHLWLQRHYPTNPRYSFERGRDRSSLGRSLCAQNRRLEGLAESLRAQADLAWPLEKAPNLFVGQTFQNNLRSWIRDECRRLFSRPLIH